MAANPLIAPGMGVIPGDDTALPIKSRGGAMPGGAPDQAMSAPQMPSMPDLQKGAQQAFAPVSQAYGRESEAQTKYLQEKAKATEAEAQQYAGKVGGLYKTAEEEKAALPFPEFHPTQDNAKDIMAVNSLIGILGVALGATGKQSAVGAMNAMAGMMDGYKAGRADLMEREKAEFDRKVKELDLHHKKIAEKLKEGIELARIDREAAQAKIGEAIAESQSSYLKAVNERQGAIEAYKKWMDLQKGIATAQTKAAAKPAATPLQELKIEKAKKSLEAEKNGPQGLTKEFLKVDLDPKMASTINSIGGAIGEAYAMADMVEKHPEIAGRSGQFRSFVDRYINSLRGAGLPPSDEESGLNQEALRFAKRYAAYLTSYERSMGGGSKGFTVYLQRRFNELMAQEQFTPDGLVRMLGDHARELASSAAAMTPAANMKNLSEMGINIHDRSGDYEANAREGRDKVYSLMGGAAQAKPGAQATTGKVKFLGFE